MFGRKQSDVLVVGAGPVGLFTALALSRRGVRVQIIDREPRTVTRSYALALHAESLRLFEELGVLDRVLEHAQRLQRVGIYDHGGRRAELRIGDLDEVHAFLAVLPQDLLEDALARELAHRGVKVHWNHALFQLDPGPEHVEVAIDRMAQDTVGYSVQHSEWVVTKTMRQKPMHVVGADGHDSTVRRRLDIEFPSVGTHSDFVVFEFQTDAGLGDEMRLCFGESTTNLCWPLPGGFCRWSFESPLLDDEGNSRPKDRNVGQTEQGQQPELGEDRLRELLAQRAPWFPQEIGGVRWRKAVRFERRLADAACRGRVYLLGDAVHMTGPAGVQSMNIGFREGMQLADTIAIALSSGAAIDDFEHHAQATRAEWRGLLGLDEILYPTPNTPNWLVAHKDRLLPCLPASGKGLARLAGQLGFECRLPDAAETGHASSH